MAGFHHFSATVTDLEASVSWYQRVLGLERVPQRFPHYGDEESGYGILLMDLDAEIIIGLHHHVANDGRRFDEARTGLDHIGISVQNRSDLNSWVSWLDAQGVAHSGVTDADEPFKYSVLVFRDPDNIQLEMFCMEG
jgi:catechol 2,3-dioxygenase-like lactoylglutathione lyase family enzyme